MRPRISLGMLHDPLILMSGSACISSVPIVNTTFHTISLISWQNFVQCTKECR